MSLIDTVMERLDQMVTKRVSDIAPFRATVASVSGGMVTIQRPGITTAETELRARVVGYDLAVNDEVLCVVVNGKPVVIGQVQRASPASADYQPPIAGGIYVIEDLVNSATTTSTTSTTNYSTNVSVAVVLPTGTWTIYAWGNGLYSHSVESSIVAHRVRIGSDAGTYLTASVNVNNTRTGLAASHTLTGQSGTVTVYLEYRVGTSGTAYAGGGSLFVIALRTA